MKVSLISLQVSYEAHHTHIELLKHTGTMVMRKNDYSTRAKCLPLVERFDIVENSSELLLRIKGLVWDRTFYHPRSKAVQKAQFLLGITGKDNRTTYPVL